MHVSVIRVTAEHHRETLGIGESRPRLTWRTAADEGWNQAAYEVEVTTAEGASSWRVDGADQVLVEWPAAPLRSREAAQVRVRVHGDDGSASDWSEPLSIEAGLLDATDWSAVPVGGSWEEDPESDDRRPALVRREFTADEGLTRARLYVTSHGFNEVEINGTRVGADELNPGWTVYGKRLRYYTYDVTDLIKAGDNVVGAWLADGWYRGRLGWRGGFYNLYGPDQSLIAQLELHYGDRADTVATDGQWRAAKGPIIAVGNYDGETYDAREELPGWSSPGFDDSAWVPVAIAERDPATLFAPTGPPVRCTQEVTPLGVLTTPSGATVVDFGQNFVGRVRIRVSGAAGDTVVIRTAEVLQDGEIYTRPLRGAKSTDTYTLAGRDSEEWEPRFTFHGFRYAEISGWPGDIAAAVERGDIVGRVLHTDMERTGWFECSEPLVNRLHENIVWSMRGNFVDIPTDCPQRDERVGWTGDLQVFAPTAAFLYDVSGMLTSWLTDVAAEQLPDGTIPWYVPVIPAKDMWTPIRPGAAWGDVASLTPWALFELTGDRAILRAQFDSARRWVDLVDSLAGEDHLWNEGFQLGDWLDPDAPPQDPADAKADRYLVATAYFARSARRVAWMAGEIGEREAEAHYSSLADAVDAAFNAEYVRADGTMTSDAQTAYALGIAFDLIPTEAREAAGAQLARLVGEAGDRISTGFVGTPLVSDALTQTGHRDSAHRLLLQTKSPSWLYAVTMGGTTVWERWDAMLPDGTVNPGTMTSFNHYALGAVGDWLHREVAGIQPTSPGYRTVRLAPGVGPGIDSASARHDCPYGTIAIEWQADADAVHVRATVPVGVAATLVHPDGSTEALSHGEHSRTMAR